MVGIGLLAVWVGALQIMLDKGKDLDWFDSTAIVVLGLVALVGFVAWLIWELTEETPIVDLSLFKSRSFPLGTLALCLGYAIFFGNVVLHAAVAAGADRLHRHLGRTGGRAERGGGGAAVTLCRAPHLTLRRTLARHRRIPVLRRFPI